MKCPRCRFENPEDTRFCGNCGTRFRTGVEIPVSQTETLPGPVEDLPRGSLFADRYEIIEKLGGGGMGDVYRVLDKNIDEEMALKLLRPEISSDARVITRFKNELKFARKIIHKNVCRMYDISEARGVNYITMEYVSGEDLKSLIKRVGQLTPGKAAFVARQVCEGLAEAHKHGVVHRDLKPSNIMIDRDGNSHIMDFGIARSLTAEAITSRGVIVGTPYYMSPEQAEGKEIDQGADIYAIGVILFEMLTGRVPFEGETYVEIAVKHKSEPTPNPKKFNPQIPEEIVRVVFKCLEKKKDSRYKSAEELLTVLNEIRKKLSSTDKVLPQMEDEAKPRRKRLLIGISLSFCLLLVAGYFFNAHILRIGKDSKKEGPGVQSARLPEQAPPAGPAVARPGRLEIGSIPEGAEVYIDDQRIGTTPFKREFPAGTYRIKIRKSPGYEETTDTMDVRAGETADKSYTLRAVPAIKAAPTATPAATAEPGYLEVHSVPEGAEVYINNKPMGTTPFKAAYPPGIYEIRLRKYPEYEEHKEALEIKPGRTASKRYTLAALYVLNIITVPESANVSIDGIAVGKSPIEMELTKGTCQLRIEKGEEWSIIDEFLTLNPGLNSLQRYLKKLRYSFSVITSPAGATVYVGNKRMGLTPLKIPALYGPCDIRMEKEGYRALEDAISIESDMEKNYNLTKLETVKVSLKVHPYANILIDGKFIGEVPPIKMLDVEEGKHTFEFITPALNKKYAIDVEIKPGENLEIRMNMETGEHKVSKLDSPQF